MFLKKNKNLNRSEAKKPKKLWKRILWGVLITILIVITSYVAYIYASGKRIFDTGNLTASPFFKKLSGQQYSLKGEGDGRINVLFLGMGGVNHPGGQLTDSIMIMSIDPDNKTMAMLSIPRDLYVPVPGTNYSRKINEIYKFGEDKKKGSGGDFAKETIGKILDLPIHYYITVDFYGFKKLIDEVGGIDVNVETAINDPLYPADDMIHYEPFKIKAGTQHLDGTTALKYSRSRHGSATGDVDRAGRQQKVIAALRQKIFDKGYLTNPKKIMDIVNIIGDHVRTDFTTDEITAMAKLTKELDFGKTISKVLSYATDGELVSDTSSTGQSIFRPRTGNWEQIQRIAHELFTDPNLIKEDAKIEVVNGSGTAGLAGKLAETLKSYNYTVVSIITGKASSKTAIYDYTNGSKSVTIDFLQKRLKVSAQKITRPANANNIDISIQLGSDYKGFAKDPSNTTSSTSSTTQK